MAAEALLDTDMLSEILRGRDAGLLQQGTAYLNEYGTFTVSIITRYEVLRGLRVKSSERKVTIFEEWCRANIVLGLSDVIVVRAAEIYAELHRAGQLISDADILIAATALAYELTLITGNVRHFQRIAGLQLKNWRTETL